MCETLYTFKASNSRMQSQVCTTCQKDQPLAEFKRPGRPRLDGQVPNPLPTCANCRLGEGHQDSVQRYKSSQRGRLSTKIATFKYYREQKAKRMEAFSPQLAEDMRRSTQEELRVIEGMRESVPVVEKDRKLREIAILGGKCKCCGEDIPEYLTFFKPNPGPRQAGKARWKYAKRENFVGWTLVCLNCAHGLAVYRKCLHARNETPVSEV